MGYNSTATTTTINAKLTPLGRKLLVSTNNALITSFSLGDSDANYFTSQPLTTGQVPSESGNIGVNNTLSNSTTQNVNLRSALIVSGNGVLKKPVESQSTSISTEVSSNGQVILSGNSLTQNIINRNDGTTNSLTNLFYSFGLSLNSTQDNQYTGITFTNGGYSDTALSGLAQNKIAVIAISDSTYGECIDGKEVKLNLVTSAGTYTIYSTFQNKGSNLKVEDTNIRDTASNTSLIGNNIAFLFSDNIMTPNGGSPSLSWSTGFGTIKPFSVNGKQLYNLQTNPNLGTTADTVVGIVYLDKGFIVLTHPQIVNNFDVNISSASTVTLNSVSTSVFQNITCIANRGEFFSSTNPTFSSGDIPRVSEIALYDTNGNIIAMGKSDRHILKNVNSPLYLGVKISL